MMAAWIYAFLIWGGWLVVIGCFIAASLYTVRIGKWLSGQKEATFSDLFTPSTRRPGDAGGGRPDYRALRRQAFTSGSDMEPGLRRLYMLERRLRRIAFAVALVVIVTSWSRSWAAEDAAQAPSSQTTGRS